jgi:hypothetical protein
MKPAEEFAADTIDERSAHEHPEQAYRRGYQQGANEVYRALKEADALPPRLSEKLRHFIHRRISGGSSRPVAWGANLQKDVAPRFSILRGE